MVIQQMSVVIIIRKTNVTVPAPYRAIQAMMAPPTHGSGELDTGQVRYGNRTVVWYGSRNGYWCGVDWISTYYGLAVA